MTLRIAHAITKGDVGGAQTHVVELAGAQHDRGHHVTIVAGCDGPAMDRARGRGVDVAIVRSLGESRSRLRHREALASVRAVLREVRPEVLHGHSSNAGLLSRLAARRDGYPSVYTAHGWPFQKGAPVHQRALSAAGEFVGARLGDAVICLTDTEAERARRSRIVPADRIHVVPNGIADVPPELRRRRESDGPLVAVMVARFAPPKQQRDLIEAVAELDDVAVQLWLVGDGPQRAACEAAAAALGDRVRILGHRDDVADLLAQCDVGVLWSTYEGMPMSLLEAMRAGLCCVANDLPGVRALFGAPPAGVVVSDRSELVRELRSLAADRPRVDELGDAARRRYETAFTVDVMCDRTLDVYEIVLAG